MRKLLSFILVCVVTMTIFTGCGLLDNTDDAANLDELTSGSLDETEVSVMKDKTPIQLYFVNEQENKLSSETRYIDNAEANKGNANLATIVVKELIKGPDKESKLKSAIPQGTTLHSDVTIKDGVATVDLSKEFISKHPGGKKQEQLTLYSIVNSLTEIKEVKSVQFKIEGKVKKEFKGSYQIDVNYPRTSYLISQPTTNNTSGIDANKENKDQQLKDNSNDKAKNQVTKDKQTSTDKDSGDKDSTDKKTSTDNNSNDKNPTDKNPTDKKTTSDQESNDVETNADIDGELLE